MKKINNKKPQHHRIKRLAVLACLLSVLSPFTPAFADDPFSSSSIVEAINNARIKILSQMELATVQLNTLFSDAFRNTFLTVNAQVPNLAMLNPVGNYVFEGSGGADQKALTPYELANNASQNLATQKLQKSLSNDDVKAQRQVLLETGANSKEALAKTLDAQNFLTPSAYTVEAQNNAERTVSFLSDYASPFGTIDLEKLNSKKELKDTDAAKTYRVKVYTNAAIRSLLLGNLYDSFNARIPVKGLGEGSGMSDKKSASIVEVEKYIASRRIKNPKWYETINSAPSIAVQREMAFVLAEIQWQLYQLHQDNEKMLQTMTALGVINLRSGGNLADSNEIQLKQDVEGTKPKEPEQITDTTSSGVQNLPPSTENGGIPPIP